MTFACELRECVNANEPRQDELILAFSWSRTVPFVPTNI